MNVDQILRMPDVVRLTGLSRSSIYRMIAEGEFPAPVRLRRQAVGWKASAVQRWSDSLEEVPLTEVPWADRSERVSTRKSTSGRRTSGGRR